MMKTLHVRGTLSPASPEATDTETHAAIKEAVHQNGLRWVLEEGNHWGLGIININSCTETSGGTLAALGFMDRLTRLINTESISKLGLQGSLMITADSEWAPVVFNVKVKDREVSYMQARLSWNGTWKTVSKF